MGEASLGWQGGPRKVGGWPSTSLLAWLAEQTREELLRLGRLQQYASGDLLLLEGDRSTHVLLLLEACVKITSNTEDGQVALLAVRMGGDLVGELASLDGEPRVATVTAAGPCVVRRFGQQEFLGFLSRYPDAALAVNRSISGKLRWATQRRVDFGTCPAPVRLARVLAEFARSYGEQVPDGIMISISLTQPELASLAGAAEPTVNKALGLLRRAGVVGTGYRRLVIRDLGGLYTAAGFGAIPQEHDVPGGGAYPV